MSGVNSSVAYHHAQRQSKSLSCQLFQLKTSKPVEALYQEWQQLLSLREYLSLPSSRFQCYIIKVQQKLGVIAFLTQTLFISRLIILLHSPTQTASKLLQLAMFLTHSIRQYYCLPNCWYYCSQGSFQIKHKTMAVFSLVIVTVWMECCCISQQHMWTKTLTKHSSV